MRAQDGKSATFFVGDRYPVSLGILQSNLASQAAAFAPGVIPGAFPRQDFPTGTVPPAVVVQDLNGDGHPDLIVANRTAGTISILLGAGDGTFGNHSDIVVGASPSAIAVGDFDGDTKMDIAVTNSGDSTVSVLLGNGDGTFAAPVTYPTGTDPVAILARDFNADGRPDLAVVNQGTGTVSILLSKMDGTFGAKTDFPVGTAPTAIASGDFNADGRADLAVTNRTDNSVSVLSGNGDGTFGAKTDYPTGNAPAGIAIADFNGDGFPDLAVSNQTDNTVSILNGNASGTFSAHTDFTTGGGPVGITAVDVTGEGNADLIIANQSSDNLTILIGNGDGTFLAPVTLPTGNGPVAVAAADLNGDARPDVVSANQTSNSVTVTLNTLQNANSSSFSQTAYPSSEYVDLGVKVKATPRLHGDDEVTIHLEFDIRSLTGTALNGIPVLSNRTIDQMIRLRENQTSVLSGIIHTDEAKSLSGWPFTSSIPGAGYITSGHTADNQQTEMLIIVTPRAVRLPARNPRVIYAGRGEPTPEAPATSPATDPGRFFHRPTRRGRALAERRLPLLALRIQAGPSARRHLERFRRS